MCCKLHLNTLKNILPGQKAVVLKINGAGAIRRRLLEMGIVAGTTVELVRYAPLGDPLELKINGALLSVRKVEAALIDVNIEESGE